MAFSNTVVYSANGITSDPQSAWTNDSNVTDLDDTTYATVAANAVAGSTTNDHLDFSGINYTSPPASNGTAEILSVAIAIKAASGVGASFPRAVNVAPYYSGVSLGLASISVNSGTLSTTSYVNIAAPSGGWTWSRVRDLDFIAYMSDVFSLGTGTTAGKLAQVYIRVTYVDVQLYEFPMMLGSGAAPGVASTNVSIGQGLDSTWSTIISQPRFSLVATESIMDDFYGRIDVDPTTQRTFNYVEDSGTLSLTARAAVVINSGSTTATGSFSRYLGTPGYWASLVNQIASTPAASTNSQFLIKKRSYAQDLHACSVSTVAASTTSYTGIQDTSGKSTTQSAEEQVIPTSGNITNLNAGCQVGSPGGSGITVTLLKNGSATSLTTTITSAAIASDTTHSVSVVAGDVVCWQIVGSAGITSRAVGITCRFEPTNPGENIITMGSTGSVSGSGGAVYNWGYGTSSWNSTEANRTAYAAKGRFTKMYVLLSAAPGAGKTRTITLRVNGADSGMAVVLSGASATTGSITLDVPVSDLDLVSVKEVPTVTTAASSTVRVGLVWQALYPNRKTLIT